MKVYEKKRAMLSHRVKGIVFNFENLEEFYVPIEQVEVFNFTNIHKDLNFWGGPVIEVSYPTAKAGGL